jgi:tRNA (cytidine32/uridine32-2'-O)-methyltransferase
VDFLSQIKIVLVEPTHPGNIGAVARSMKTMGLETLVLVNPKKFPHYEASKRAAGAESVLQTACVVPTLDDAIADCSLVLGTSVRDREVSWPTVTPHQAAQQMATHWFDNRSSVAILFGRESSGLTNAELDRCRMQIRIPANPDYSSLNLASAVQIITYELRMQWLVGQPGPIQSEQAKRHIEKRWRPASKEQQADHIQHLQNTLESLDFIKSKPPTLLMRKLIRLYNKADLTIEEIQILRGILSAVDAKLET